MGEKLIKPYEISVWEDRLTQIEGSNPAEYTFQEIKLAVIGSDTMSGPNKIYDPVFSKKVNGEKTLTFSLHYKYFDPYSATEDVINPFAALLINERKVKLHYDNEWYEFIVKEHTESSDGLEWTYSCVDAFVLELSKNGYNLEFSTDLNNNQGTARDLAKKVLEDTDWKLGTTQVGKQLIEEPVYSATLWNTDLVDIINVNEDGTAIPGDNTKVYVFYSYVKNENGKFVQFVLQDSNNYVIDDNNVVTTTNFRITTDLVYEENSFKTADGDAVLLIDSYEAAPGTIIPQLETQYKFNRLAYNQLTTYDPVMGRTVDRFKLGDREVYRYTDYTYTTSNVITNFIANGDNFNVLEDGTLQGWNPYVGQADHTPPTHDITKLELVTKPEIKAGSPLVDINLLSQIEGFLKVHFEGPLDATGQDAVFNDGVKYNTSFIQSITQGEEFVFRWRAAKGEIDNLTEASNLGLIVAKYQQDTPGWGRYYKYLDLDNIILYFDGSGANQPQKLNNTITGGTIENTEDGPVYIIDDVVQTVSTKYIYESEGQWYYWDGETSEFKVVDENYRSYYYLTAKARRGIANTVLSDPTEKIGIFLFVTGEDAEGDYFIQDVQLTRCIRDGNGQPILMGNIPTATARANEYYYLKPGDGLAAEDIITYISPEELIDEIGTQDSLIPLYNEGSEKYLTISASKSNCFDVLQTIAETFECWVDLKVNHDDQGKIKLDEEGKPQKFVYLKEFIGEDNYAGFKYGINLSSIERTINSDEIVTKLIVNSSQSDYVDEGAVSIANAKSNISGESYILNFDYYYNQNLLDRDKTEEDRIKFISDIKDINKAINEKETKRIDLENSFNVLGSKRNVYTELIDAAQDTQTRALADFEQLTGESYEDYRTLHPDKELEDEDTVYDTLGDIYVSSATINNYSGLLANIDAEYWEVRTALRGSENYTVYIWTDTDELDQRHVFVELNDYLQGFSFTLGGSTYESTVSIRYFDLITDSTEMVLTAPQDYTINGSNSITYTINDNKVQKYKIICDQTIPGIEDEIDELLEEKKEKIKDFNNKYHRFILEGTWSSTDYIDAELYYLDALQVSHNSAQPTVSYTINVVEVSQLEGLELYNFDVGEKTYVEDTEFFGWANKNGILTPAREEVIISEVEWHLEEPEQNVITVQNFKTRFEDLFQRLNATVQTVQYNEATYAKMSSLLDADGTINQDVLLESLQRIAGKQYNLTSDGSVLIDGDKILVQNLSNTANRVIIDSEGIRISSDGGVNWTTAINGRGINIGTVYTGTLNTDQIVIGSEDNPSFRWDKSGISAYKSNVDGTYDLKTYVRYDQYGLYGIKNDQFKADSLDDVLDKAHFAVTWDGFFIKNDYKGGGRVEITSDNDFRVLKDINGTGDETEVIKIGALEWNGSEEVDKDSAPTLYGIRIKGKNGVGNAFKADDQGNLEVTGTINATAGNFTGVVNVGNTSQDHIIIDGTDASISSSNYSTGAGSGWMINKSGDAIFNNITARGAIKTAVFEYAEIQAVGGVFIFRPSSTIRSAAVNGDDLVLTVEKPILFKDGDWCKVSNYTENGEADNPDVDIDDDSGDTPVEDIIKNNGLSHVYQISDITTTNNITYITLDGAAAMIGQAGAVRNKEQLIGGALVDMGNTAGTSNYGIGINSSDNSVNLPRRAISLFETEINENDASGLKVRYKYKAVLGTLPVLEYSGPDAQVSELYNRNLKETQGIFTDNVYIGDKSSYLAFYTDKDDNNKKKLRISGADIYLTAADEQSGTTIIDVIDNIEIEGGGGEGIVLTIESSNSLTSNYSAINTTLTAHVYQNGNEINNYSSKWKVVWTLSSKIIYVLTTDTTVDATKTYYIYNSAQKKYEQVESPVDANIGTYYELFSGNKTLVGPTCTIGALDYIDVSAELKDIGD